MNVSGCYCRKTFFKSCGLLDCIDFGGGKQRGTILLVFCASQCEMAFYLKRKKELKGIELIEVY